ncbi:hypothetical protein ACLOJK_000169 [Asimina triloba]
MAELNWRHHTLIQSLMSGGPLKEPDFHSIFAGVIGKNPGRHQQLFNECLSKINKELALAQFELRGCRNQYDGMVYYGIVNNVADEQSKLGTKYSVPQIALYKAVIETIAQDANAYGSITDIEALNLSLDYQTFQASQGNQSQTPPAFKNFSMSQKEKALKDLIQDQWLCSPTNGSVGIGIRSFLDLRSWFQNNEVPPCNICNEAGVKVDKACPGCGAEWQCPEVSPDGEEGENVSQVSRPTPSKRKRIKSCPDEVGSPETSQPIHRKLRRSERLR